MVGVEGISSGAVKYIEIRKNTNGKRANTDMERWKLGEQMGLDTPLVLTGKHEAHGYK